MTIFFKKISKYNFFSNDSKYYFLLFFLISFLYLPPLFYDFVWDDFGNLVNNPYVKSFKNVFSFFIKGETSAINIDAQIYRPIRNILFCIEWKYFGENPFLYKLVNLLLHFFNVSFIFLFSFHFLKFSKLSAFFISLFFGIHPLTTEVLCPVKGIEDIICVLFGILSFTNLKLFLKYDSCKNAFYSLLFYFLCIFSKESGLFLFFIFFVEIISFNKLKKLKTRCFIYGALFVTISYFILRTISLQSLGQAEYLKNSMFQTLYYMSDIFLGYLKVIILPYKQIVNYMGLEPYSNGVIITNPFWGWFLIFILIIPFLLLHKTRKNIFYFILSILPVSNIIPMMQWGAERFLYFPLLFFSFFLGSLTEYLSKYFNRKIILIFMIIYISLLFYLNNNRQKIWADNASLGKEMLNCNPESYQGFHLVLSYYKKHNMYDEIIDFLKFKIDMPYSESSAYEYLAYAYINTENNEEALNVINQGLKKFPNSEKLLDFKKYLNN